MERERGTWKAVAFASRYGRADPDTTMRWTWRRLNRFNDAVAELIKDENEIQRAHTDG